MQLRELSRQRKWRNFELFLFLSCHNLIASAPDCSQRDLRRIFISAIGCGFSISTISHETQKLHLLYLHTRRVFEKRTDVLDFCCRNYSQIMKRWRIGRLRLKNPWQCMENKTWEADLSGWAVVSINLKNPWSFFNWAAIALKSRTVQHCGWKKSLTFREVRSLMSFKTFAHSSTQSNNTPDRRH